MNNLEDYIGKQFKCDCEGFEGCIGDIVHTWNETEGSFVVTYFKVVGDDFEGAFNLNEGDVL